MSEFNLLLYIVVLAYLWFDTDAFLEYASWFGLGFTKHKEFKNRPEEQKSFDYHTFLLFKYNSFFVRLITCPICLITWFNIILIGFTMRPANFAANLILTWLMYFALRWVIKKTNE
jgi:hypothetical protein